MDSLKAALARLGISYFLIYMLPFPLTLLRYIPQIPVIGKIPGLSTVTDFIPGLYSWAMNPLVVWTGDAFFGVEVTLQATGSGDRTYNYVQLAVTAVLAVVVAVAWNLVARARPALPDGNAGQLDHDAAQVEQNHFVPMCHGLASLPRILV